jgi:16S rRNA (cytosine1402-N4)-methyltransferase
LFKQLIQTKPYDHHIMTPKHESPLDLAKHKRRPRYRGTHPRRFDEKYKEQNPTKYPETVQKILESGKTPAGSHRSIMLTEILQILAPKPGEIAVDATLGYGGHAEEVISHILPGGRLIGLDVDPFELPKTEMRLRAKGIPQESLIVSQTNFAGLSKVLGEHQISGVDIVIADLGCSSMQFDNPQRGFSYKREGPLDLRMNPSKGRPAYELLKSLNEKELVQLFEENADEPRAIRLARAIVKAQSQKPITKTGTLTKILRAALSSVPADVQEREGDTPIQRVFQALRIAVNDEFSALESFLRILPTCMNSKGRVAILSFHSGEDRRVKKAFQEGLRAGVYSEVSPEVIRPTPEEMRANPRSSSAKLRWAIRA